MRRLPPLRPRGLGLKQLRADEVADQDPPRLHCLRDVSDQLDVQHAVLELRCAHLNMVREPERALERASSDAAVQELTLLLVFLALTTGDREHAFTRLDSEVRFRESRDGE